MKFVSETSYRVTRELHYPMYDKKYCVGTAVLERSISPVYAPLYLFGSIYAPLLRQVIEQI